MKTINRVRKNRTVRTTSKQSQKAMPTAPEHPSYLAVLDRKSGCVVSEVPITPAEFCSVVKLAIEAGITPAEFIGRTVLAKIYTPQHVLKALDQISDAVTRI